MDSYKLLGIEFRFKAADRFSQEMGFLSAMYRDVISLGFNPVNFFRVEKIDSAATFNHEAFQILVAGFEFLEQRENPLVRAAVSFAVHLRFRSLPSQIESLFIKGFEQVIKGINFKSPDSVLVVS